jgi:hypothetical protein
MSRKKRFKGNTTIYVCVKKLRDIYVVIFIDGNTGNILCWKASTNNDATLLISGVKKLTDHYELKNPKYTIQYFYPNDGSFISREHQEFLRNCDFNHQKSSNSNDEFLASKFIQSFFGDFIGSKFSWNANIDEFNNSFTNFLRKRACEPFIKKIPDIQMRKLMSILLNTTTLALSDKADGYSRFFNRQTLMDLGIEINSMPNKLVEIRLHQFENFG